MASLAAAFALSFAVPLVAFDDCPCGVTPVQRDRLRAQAAHRLTVPALRLQVTKATAPTDDADAALGVVAIRGPFGIRTGEVEFQANGQEQVRRSLTKEAAAWSLLVFPIAAAGAASVGIASRT